MLEIYEFEESGIEWCGGLPNYRGSEYLIIEITRQHYYRF